MKLTEKELAYLKAEVEYQIRRLAVSVTLYPHRKGLRYSYENMNKLLDLLRAIGKGETIEVVKEGR